MKRGLFAAMVLVAVVGCGSGEDLFGGATSGAGGQSSTGSTGADTGTGESATSGSGGSGSVSAAQTASSSTGVGGMSEGGSGGSPMREQWLDCGANPCPYGGDSACCWDAYQLYGAPQAECVMGPPTTDGCDTTETPAGGYETRIECQVHTQCPSGQLCCAHRLSVNGYAYYETTTCQPSCSYPDIELCDGQSYDCPELPLQQGGTVKGQCQQSQLLPPGYTVCGYPP